MELIGLLMWEHRLIEKKITPLQSGYRFDQEFTNKNYRERMKKLLK